VIENIVRHMGRRFTLRGVAEGGRRDRLYHCVDQLSLIACHSAVPDERLCRVAVPRICHHGERGSRPLAADLITLTPMMCSLLLKPESKEHGWLYRSSNAARCLLNAYEAGLKVVLRHQFITLMTMLGTIALRASYV